MADHLASPTLDTGNAGNVQDAVFAFLADPTTHGALVKQVERIDTHAAVVFLAGDLAYKVKRAVRFAYLDFRTLEKRRLFCEREVALNKKTAPDIYLSVIPIVRRADGSFAIGGSGEVMEWVVKMRRFDQAGLFDRLAGEDALPIGLMAPLAATIADLHARSRPVRGTSAAQSMARVVDSIATSLTSAPPLLEVAKVQDFARDLRAVLRAGSTLLGERARKGYVRRCHGDLHLRNIVLIDGKPVLFDAIEFDEDIATVDVLYDLAFLLMDLCHRGLDAHANSVFNAYLHRRGDRRPLASLAGLALLPLFLGCRAGVRAMVTLDRLQFVSGADRDEALRELEEFFELARAFLRPHPPRLVAVGGLSGTGKSTLAAALAPHIGGAPGAYVIRSDVERKRLAGVGETTRLGSSHYSAAATGQVYRALNAKAQAALAAGRSVVLDAVFAREDQRGRVEQVAEAAKVPFTGLWLEAPDRQLIERVVARTGDASDADAAIVRRQLGYKTGPISWIKVDAGGDPETVRLRAAKELGLKDG